METAPRTDTSHEARARNAKAMALATVLLDLESVETPDDVDLLDPEDWAVAAAEATKRELLGRTASGKVRRVHVPGAGSGDPQATIDAVARILGDLIAHEADQAAIAEQVAPRATVGMLDEPTVYDRRPTDSQGYRSVVRELDPTTAAAFKAFGQAGR